MVGRHISYCFAGIVENANTHIQKVFCTCSEPKKNTTCFICKMAENLGVEELADFLLDNGIPVSTVTVLDENGISGKHLPHMTDDDLQKLLPRMGDRLDLRQVMLKMQEVSQSAL